MAETNLEDVNVLEVDKKQFVVKQLQDIASLCIKGLSENTYTELQRLFENINANRQYLEELGVTSFQDFSRMYLSGLDHEKIYALRSYIDYFIVNKSGRILEATREKPGEDGSYVSLKDFDNGIYKELVSDRYIDGFEERLSKSSLVEKESLIGLSRVIQEARRSNRNLLAGLYHTTTGRSLPGMTEYGALLSGDQILAKGKQVFAGEGVSMLRGKGAPIFQNPSQVSFADYVERRYGKIDWFTPQDQLISIGVNEQVYGGADGSRGVQYDSPYPLSNEKWHSIVCDPELLEETKAFVQHFELEEPPLVLTTTMYKLYVHLCSRSHPFGYYLNAEDRDTLIVNLGNSLQGHSS